MIQMQLQFKCLHPPANNFASERKDYTVPFR